MEIIPSSTTNKSNSKTKLSLLIHHFITLQHSVFISSYSFECDRKKEKSRWNDSGGRSEHTGQPLRFAVYACLIWVFGNGFISHLWFLPFDLMEKSLGQPAQRTAHIPGEKKPNYKMKQDGKEITGKKEGKNADELFENTWTARPSFPTNKKTDVKWIASKQWKKGGSTVSDHLSKEKTRESVEKRHFDIVKWYKHRDKKKKRTRLDKKKPFAYTNNRNFHIRPMKRGQ